MRKIRAVMVKNILEKLQRTTSEGTPLEKNVAQEKVESCPKSCPALLHLVSALVKEKGCEQRPSS